MSFKKIFVIVVSAAAIAAMSPVAASGQDAKELESAFIKVAEKVGPAVVTISMERTGRVAVFGPGQYYYFRRYGPKGEQFEGERDPMEQFFREFFGELPEREFKQQGLGSGVIIDKDGYILTNQHVIEGADKITVILSDGRSFKAEVKGEDRRSDLAVIKIDAANLPYAELGDSDHLKPGQWAIAIGNPFGHVVRSPQPTVTTGVISALHRSLPFTAAGADRSYMNLIQTDAAINMGNSGGPLCDIDGKIIGINVAIFSQFGGNIGIGFAIPVNTAKAVLEDLIEGKSIRYGWLGVSAQNITQEIADYFGMRDLEGALIAEVIEGSPAQGADLQAGDIVKSYKGEPVKDAVSLSDLIGRSKVGDKVRLKIIRDKSEKEIQAVIGERPHEVVQTSGPRQEVKAQEIPAWRGMKISAITDELARRLNLTDRSGVVIVEVMQDGPAYNVGLRPGDVIKEINRVPISNEADYKRTIAFAKGKVLLRTDKGYFILGE